MERDISTGPDSTKTVLSCRVERHKLEEIHKVAKRDYRSVSRFILMLIDKYLEEERKKSFQGRLLSKN
jgi:metal-responsive CopG/Arc/MetJ family transcriptional regulator